MNTESIIHVALLIVIAASAFYFVWACNLHLSTVGRSYVLAACLLAVSLVSVWFVDTNLPLSSSHYRPGGEAAPAWLAAFVYFLRSAAFASIALAVSKHRKSEEPKKEMHAMRETRAPDS